MNSKDKISDETLVELCLNKELNNGNANSPQVIYITQPSSDPSLTKIVGICLTTMMIGVIFYLIVIELKNNSSSLSEPSSPSISSLSEPSYPSISSFSNKPTLDYKKQLLLEEQKIRNSFYPLLTY